jgi:glucan 1,4-alpha-glucosidase
MRKTLALAATLVPLLLAPGAAAQTAPPADTADQTTTAPLAPLPPVPATDGPGAASHFDLARKDCFGTARNTRSKVWYTLANGVLSDVYYPTIDNTNVETLQYIVTDGSTFTDLQSRDMTYSVSLPDSRSLGCEVTTTAKSGKYRIVSRYVTDPNNQTLLVSVRFAPLIGAPSDYRLYVRLDPSINGNGGGTPGNGGSDSGTVDTSNGHAVPVACDLSITTNAVNRDYAQPVCSALDTDNAWLQVTNGFDGQPSDALIQLDASHSITAPTTVAKGGNIVQTTQADLRHGHQNFTFALGFGQTAAQAAQATRASLRSSFKDVERDFNDGWSKYDDGLVAPPRNFKGLPGNQWRKLVDEYYLSLNAVKASEDKTFPGALVASVSSPWGQAIVANDPDNTYFGSYREVFARDVYEAWTGLLVAGDRRTARDVVNFLFTRQQLSDGSFPRNSLVNGKTAPDSFNTQLDECSYPILMAWQLGMTDASLYANHIKPAANFVISHGPSFGPERWEEQGGFSPSTISAEVAGLISAADIAEANHDSASAAVWRGVADSWQRQLEGWTVTTNGLLATHPYFIRLSKTGDPNAAISYGIGNGGPTLDQRSVIDAGFLEMVRLGLVPFNDSAVVETLPVVDQTIETTTPSGPGWHRYNSDGYGDGATDGHPWAPSGRGTGHLWPLLAEERGEYNLLSGGDPKPVDVLQTLLNGSSGVGLIPEQDWELPDLAASAFGTDPTIASIGFRDGHPAGSAAPLTWASGVYARLLNDMVANRLLEQPTNTVERYVQNHQGQTTLTLNSPVDQSSVSTDTVTVSGMSVPGNSIAVAATNVDTSFQTTTATTTAAAGTGAFSVSVPITGGTTVFNVVATNSGGATGLATASVVFDFTPGTVLLDVTDQTNDDNGPGNYAYPTAPDFHPGAFDIQEFKVISDGTNVTFKLKTRDLSPTFGSPLGAQLVDVYVHTPGVPAADTSTAASFAQRNYQIAPDGAWNRLIEVQGFGQRYVDAHGAVLGTVNISANAISRFITFSVPQSSLGTPGSGWGFSVVLTGQDGFSPDQARSFTSTPQSFNFGVCANSSSDPHCTADPNSVPKAMDVLTPAGVLQSDELDYTVHKPVIIQPVTIP